MNVQDHLSQPTLCAQRRCVSLILVLTLFGLSALTASYAQTTSGTQLYTLPGDAVFPEGVAYDASTGDFFVGSTRDGTVYRGNVRDSGGELEVFLAPGADGRTGVTGMKVDAQGRLFIAGRDTGRAFVYDTASGNLIDVLETPAAPNTLINDVTVMENAAYFTDSFRPILFRVPLTSDSVGEMETWLSLENSPITYQNGFNLNGIAATDDGRYLLTVQFNTGQLFRIDTETREVTQVDLGGTALMTGDGLVLNGQTLYVVRETPAEVVPVALADDFASGEVGTAFTDPSLDLPTTAAQVGERLLIVNSQLDGTPVELPFTVSSISVP